MSDYYVGKDDKIDFKQICLGHYKKILEITTNEFTGGYYNYIYSNNTTSKQYVTDKRAEFTQAVESLALALFPHFDEQMKKDYQKYLKAEKEIYSKYADEDGFIRHTEDNANIKHSIEKVGIMKELFKDLSSLMYRLDYFKTASYSEGDLDEASDIVDVDGKNQINKTKEEREDG